MRLERRNDWVGLLCVLVVVVVIELGSCLGAVEDTNCALFITSKDNGLFLGGMKAKGVYSLWCDFDL